VLIRAFVALSLAVTAPCAWADANTDRAKQLLEQRQPKAAYEILAPLEAERAGDPEFDYLLGVAAVDAGEAERAVFALERVLALQPDNLQARAEIARAYFMLGERATARREFEAVRSRQVPPEVRATIERFLAAIASRETTQFEAYLEAGVGTDSNVNSATSSGQIAIPSLGGAVATLNAAAISRRDSFTNLAAGFNLTHKLSETWALVGGGSATARFNHSETAFNTISLDGNLGGRWSRGANAITLGTQLQKFELDDAPYRDTIGMVAQWQHSFDDARQGTLFGQRSRLSYPGQSVRDADRTVLGAAYAQAFAGSYSPVMFASAYGGREDERAANVPHLGHELLGARLGVRLTLGGGWSLAGNASHEERRYGGPDPLFLTPRRDRQTDLSASVSYLFRPGINLQLQLSHTDNQSNLEINRFRRTTGLASARWTF